MNTKQEAKEYIRDCALLTDYGRELMTTLLKELEAHYESWKQHMDVSVNNARYIVELEMKLEATERKLAEAEQENAELRNEIESINQGEL